MIRHFTHINIDKDKWDAAIDKAVNGNIYAKTWYLDIVSPRGGALADEDYKTVMPLTWRSKFGFKYLFPPFFTQQLGIFSQENLNSETIQHFLQSIPKDIRFIEIQLNYHNRFQSSEFKISQRLTHHLALNHPYEQLQKKYSENLRRNLKKATQHNHTIIPDFKTADLITLFRSVKGNEISTLKDSNYQRLQMLMDEAEQRNLLTKLAVHINNQLAAGVLFLHSSHEYILIFSAVNEEARQTGAMSFLIDTFIRSHANEKMNLDFEGSMDANLARFYKSFGTAEVVYLQIKKNNLPIPIRWLKH
jgi:hypothetical protein